MNINHSPGHTAGSWVYAGGRVYLSYPRTNGFPTVKIGGANRDEPETSPAERDSNCRLMAAAPDLLAALEIMVRAFNADDIDPLVAFASIEKARDAIAKARNE